MVGSSAAPADLEVLVAFLNTVDQRTFTHNGRRHEPHDELSSPTALARWLAEHGLTDRPGGLPRATHEDLADAIAVREALRDGLVAALDDAAGPQEGHAESAGTLAEAAGHPDASSAGTPAALETFPLRLVVDRTGGGLSLDCTPPRSGAVNQGLATLVAAAATAGIRGTWDRVRLCAAPDCRWAFQDSSRRGDKRWCATAVCGNRRKTADYRTRQREA